MAGTGSNEGMFVMFNTIMLSFDVLSVNFNEVSGYYGSSDNESKIKQKQAKRKELLRILVVTGTDKGISLKT